MVLQGQEVGKTNFSTRSMCIDKEIIGPRHVKIKSGQLDKLKEPFSVRMKPFWDVSTARKVHFYVFKRFIHSSLNISGS